MSQVIEEIREKAYEVLDQEKWEQCVMDYFDVKTVLLERLDNREWNLEDILEYGKVFNYACGQASGYVCRTMTALTKEILGEADMEIRCNACMAGSVFCERVRTSREDFHYNLVQIYYRYQIIERNNELTDSDRDFINICVERAKTSVSQLDDLLEVARRWSDEL
jgi:hypothetical protein